MKLNLSLVILAAALMAATLSLRTLAQTKPSEKIVNPTFATWVGCKPGTTLVSKGTTQASGQDVDLEVTTKLLEINDEKAVIEIATVASANGMNMPQPARKIEVTKIVDKSELEKPGKGFDPALLDTAKEESVTVPAGTFKAKMIEFTRQQGGMTMKIKSWFTPEVPGGSIKQEMHGEGSQNGMQMSVETKFELTSIDKK